jgi:hypothetical protein
VKLDVWRGQEGLEKQKTLTDYNEQYYLIKEEMTHFGTAKLILKDKKTGQIIEKVV